MDSETNTSGKNFFDKMESLRIHALEKKTLELLKDTRWGRIYAMIYLLIGISSFFIYLLFFKLNSAFSFLLGCLTWFGVSFMVDTILIKTQRIDKQYKFLLGTEEGITMLKKQGVTDEEIEKIRRGVETDPLFQCYLENKPRK